MASTDDLENPFDRLVLDADGNGRLTAADLGVHLGNLFFLPGDGLIWLLATYAAPIAQFFGIGTDDYGGVMSAFVSSCVWLAAFIGTAILYQGVLDFDRRVTSGTKRFFSTLALRARIARTLLAQRWRKWQASRVPANRADVAVDLELSPSQLQALRLHAELPPGYALSVSDTAEALGARTRAAQNLLDGLKDLGLLNRTLGSTDDETTYRLTAAGKALLRFRQLR